VAFTFTIQISDPNHFQQDAALVADLQKAASDWGVYIGGFGSIDIQINIAATASGRAGGGANAVVPWATDGFRIVYQNGTIAELVNGIDPNGGASDLTITIDPTYLQNELWLDPDPFNASAIPVNRTDAVSIFRHELGHAFGIEGYRSSGGLLPSGFETTWDRLVQINGDGSASFVGADATAAYGGAVPVTTLQNGEQYFHLGNGADAASSDLMNGIVFNRGVSYNISHLDVAILRDLGVPTTSASDLPSSDFNGDGHGDLLWQNADGTPAAWLLNGTSLVAGANIGFNPGASWHTKGLGDFNGDGKADVLWQNDDGTPAVWLMNGLSVSSGANVGSNPGPSWHVVAAADFNGDGRADILWQNTDGTPAIWLMNGTSLIAGASLFNPGPSWHVIEAGDFNGDGKADILWQNDGGLPAIWYMDGASIAGFGPNLPNPGATWHAIAAADFNGDGKADILLQNDDGTPAVWLLDGTGVPQSAGLPNPGAGWHVKDAADFNGDGKADILWQNDSGLLAIWFMDGASIAGFGPNLPDPGPGWHEAHAADINGDGKADIVWHNDNGSTSVWLMDTNGIASILPALPNTGAGWHIVPGNHSLPVILDLDGNGVDVTPLGASSASFDMNGSGGREHTAWAGSHDGILAIDLAEGGSSGPDGVIDQTKEIVFSAWDPGATSDMQALREVFDTNHNGTLDAGDARWSEFRVWVDANGDGVSQPGEVKTLTQLGIASIDLNPKGPATTFGDGSMIQGLSTFTRTDGTTGAAGDVALAFEPADASLSKLIQAMAVYSTASSGLGAGSIVNGASDPVQQGAIAASWHP
jgi:hypothetical protein